jgi:hypothetical protein
MDMFKPAPHFLMGDGQTRDGFRGIIVIGDDQIEDLPA